MKKKILALIMASLMGITLVACGEEKKEPTGDNKPAAEEPADGGQTENVKLTEDDVRKIMKDMEEGLKSEFANAKDLEIEASDKDNILTCSLDTVKPDPHGDGYIYDGIRYYYAEAISKGSHDSLDIKFSMAFSAKDIKSGKVKFDINKTIIPTFYKYLVGDDFDLSKFNEEVNDDARYKASGDGEYGDFTTKEDGKIMFTYAINPASTDTLGIDISITRQYK